MQWREKVEKNELETLSPFAAKSNQSRGRQKQEDPCAIRTDFQRDRDRLIHSKAFRRLKDKTQVFIAPEGDHFRTRLTHTLEVAQISRTIARALRLNEDLTEAIALGHDLGHTPFGHAGEDALSKVVPDGFRHNFQSLRVVDKLERRTGLNLTWEVRDGILNHTGDIVPATLEGQIVKIADRVAYINHDIDDAVRAGVIRQEDLPGECLEVLGWQHSQRINTMVIDLIIASQDQPRIAMSPAVQEATDRLRTFLFDRVYIGSVAKTEESKAIQLVQKLYRYYVENPVKLPSEYHPFIEAEGVERAVCDYIAGMTDSFAISQFQQLFVPRPFAAK
ncbi:MAG: deoxyguanosinetriphosphate triphosphohydrolase [Bacillota bacterium]